MSTTESGVSHPYFTDLIYNYKKGSNSFATSLNEDLFILGVMAGGAVIDIASAPPGDEAPGDVYLITNSGATGDFAGKEGQIATYNEDNSWIFFDRPEGCGVIVRDEFTIYAKPAGASQPDAGYNKFRASNAPNTVPAFEDFTDSTKTLKVDVSGLTTGRTMTLADENVTPLSKTGGTMTGNLNLGTYQLNQETKGVSSSAPSVYGTTIAITDNELLITLDASWSPTIFTGWSAVASSVQKFRINVIQGAGGSFTITWPAGVKWPANTAPTQSTNAAATMDIYEFVTFDAGVTIYGSRIATDLRSS